MTLEEVETEISAITAGSQSFTLGDLTQQKARLSELADLRTQLLAEAGRSDGTRPLFRGFRMTNAGYG